MWNNEDIMKEMTDEEAAEISGGKGDYSSITGPCGKPVSLFKGQYCQVRGMYGDVCKSCDYNPQAKK